MVALSVGEAEYMELASTGQQASWLKSFSREIGFHIVGPIPLCSDNQAAIFLTINPAVECHIDIQHHYIREQYEEKGIEPFHVTGEENPADLFTKSLPVIKGEIEVQNQIVIDVRFSGSVEVEYHEMLFQLETKHSNKELYWIIA